MSVSQILQDRLWDISILNWIMAGVFVFVGLLLRRFVSVLCTRVLYSLIKSKFGDYSGTQFKELLTKPISGLIGNFFFFLALTRLLPKVNEVIIIPAMKKAAGADASVNINAAISLFDILKHILFLGFIYYGFMLIARSIEYILNLRYHKAIQEKERNVQQILPLMKDIIKVIVWVLGFIVALGVVLHINVAALVAGLGVGGIAIAFAAKESLENLIASFMVLVDKPFTIGDWIKVDGVEGTIEKVGFRSSRIRTFDKSVIVVPNRKLIDSNVENYSLRGYRRVTQVIGGIYGISRSNIEKAIAEIKTKLLTLDGINKDLGVNMWLDGFGDSQLNLNLHYYVVVSPKINFTEVKHQANFIIYEAMYRHCQGFAFPTQTEIHSDPINEVDV